MNEWNFFTILLQVIILLTIFSQIFVAYKIVSESDGAEQFVRTTAIAAGTLIFLGSKALNITFADLMFLALTDASLLGIITVGAAAPIIIGLVVAQVTISAIASGNDFAIRILLLMGVFILVQILYLNYFALTQEAVSLDKALLPNLCYSLSVSLWIVFRYKNTMP